ncbi:MAG: hypothetical protein QOF69_1701, partial [Solirubrobacteraceae bacterium]|nr:hypothetical protein [Solirubrobacteraceae bacterium]
TPVEPGTGAITVGGLATVWVQTGWPAVARVALAVLIATVLFFASAAIDTHARGRRLGDG